MRAFVFLALAVVLLGCAPRAIDYVQYTGTEGVTLAFAPGAPPEQVNEGMPFPVKVTVQNKGALDVPYERMLLTFSADPLYVDKGLLQLKPSEADLAAKLIRGRSAIYRDGETRSFSVPGANAFTARAVPGALQRPSSSITASVCYAYTTHLATEVCVDTFQENERAQSCRATDLAFTSGQGAPIDITAIEVEAYPVYDDVSGAERVRPFFTIHVHDTAGGLIGPDTLTLATACLLKDIPQTELGAVRVEAWLLDQPLECQPAIVKLYDGEGETRCSVPMSGLSDPVYQVTQNFLTTLTVNATYLYKTAARADFTIKRSLTPLTGVPATRKVEGYVYDGDLVRTGEDGKPVTVCDTYAANPAGAPDSAQVRPDSSCACSQDECLRIIKRGGACVLKGGVCPSPLYCCSGTPPPEEPDPAEPATTP